MQMTPSVSDSDALHLPSNGFPTHPMIRLCSPPGLLLDLRHSDVLARTSYLSWEFRKKGETFKSVVLALLLVTWGKSLNVFELYYLQD